MQLTGAQADAFWKVYDAYEVDRKVLGQKKFQLIKAYAEIYLQTSIRSAIQDEIPFIGEIDRTIKH